MGEDLNIPLLDRLRANAGQWLGTTELGLAARRLSDEVEKLRRAGARIDVEDRRGACLLEWPDRLHPDELQWELGTAVIGRRILVYQETASTNDVAWQLSGSSELEGVAVFAESQTRGRGRHGRSWADAPGKGLLFSVLLTPDLPVETSNALTVLGGVAVCEAIQSLTGLAAYLKWPNDVVVGGRKLAGIIVETRGGEAQSPAAFVLGVGINVGQRKDEFPVELRERAASISMVTAAPRRVELARALLRNLDCRYRELCRGETGDLEKAWRTRCTAGSDVITLEHDGQAYTGRVVDVDLRDGLILQLPSGGLRAFRCEHVSVRPE